MARHGEGRATRYPLHLAVRYRRQGSSEWHSGRCLNISCSGMLFRGGMAVEPSAMVEVAFPVPPQLAGGTDLRLLCTGSVVRTEREHGGAAIAFSSCRLVPRQAGTAQGLAAPPVPRPIAEFAHRVNNHLMIILGFCELLAARDDLPPDARSGVEQILASAQTITDLIRQFRSQPL